MALHKKSDFVLFRVVSWIVCLGFGTKRSTKTHESHESTPTPLLFVFSIGHLRSVRTDLLCKVVILIVGGRMSDKDRRKKDGENKDKKNKRMRESVEERQVNGTPRQRAKHKAKMTDTVPEGEARRRQPAG
jgi:hypothetical protein